MPPKPPESELKRLAELLRMSLSELKELMRHGVIVQTDSGSIDTAQSLLSISRHLLSTRSTAEAKARAAKADAELKELKTAEAKRSAKQKKTKKKKNEEKEEETQAIEFDPVIAMRIIERLCAGESAISAALSEGISNSVLYSWKRSNKDFSDKYAHARTQGYETWIDRILWLLEKVLELISDKDLEPAEKGVRLQGYRLILDTLKWQLSKMLPKVYGDRTQMVLETPNASSILPKHTAEEDAAFMAMLAEVRAKTPAPEPITHDDDE